MNTKIPVRKGHCIAEKFRRIFILILPWFPAAAFSQASIDWKVWLDHIIQNPEYSNIAGNVNQMRQAGMTDSTIILKLDCEAQQRNRSAVTGHAAQPAKRHVRGMTMCDSLDIGVESGTFGAWIGEINTKPNCPDTGHSWVPIPIPSTTRFRIVGTQPDDKCADVPGVPIPLPSPLGGNYSIRLGDTAVEGRMERISVQFIVQPEDTNFMYQYAVVFQDPTDHLPADKPFFDFVILDQSGDTVPCSFQHYISGPGLSGFYSSNKSLGLQCYGYDTPDTSAPVYYKPWTIVGVNLANYIGQQVTVICTNSDCALCGHFGYTYLDFSCRPLLHSSEFCVGEDSCLLVAPYSSNYSYVWSTGETNDSIYVNPLFTDTVYLEINQSSGCSFHSMYVVEPTILDAAISHADSCRKVSFADISTVYNGTIQTRLWDFGDGFASAQKNPVHNYANPGSYTVKLTITTLAGCNDTDSVIVIIPQPPVISATPDVTICQGDPVQIGAMGGVSYSWTPAASLNNAALAMPTASPNTSTRYTVTALDIHSCSGSDTTNVFVSPKVQAQFNYSVRYHCDGAILTLADSSLHAKSWSWHISDRTTEYTGQTPPFILVPYNDQYIVTLVAENPPCIDSISKTIAVGTFDSYGLLEPVNVFTPNGDGMNDCFQLNLHGDSLSELDNCYDLIVFNRWGRKVFESTDSQRCWNGNLPGGGKAEEGTYYYICSYGTIVRKGSLSLFR